MIVAAGNTIAFLETPQSRAALVTTPSNKSVRQVRDKSFRSSALAPLRLRQPLYGQSRRLQRLYANAFDSQSSCEQTVKARIHMFDRGKWGLASPAALGRRARSDRLLCRYIRFGDCLATPTMTPFG